MRTWLWAFVLVGCNGIPEPSDGSDTPNPEIDDDGDGYDADEDCDDNDSAIYPGADERCNEVDDDCDTEIDEDAVDALELWTDDDGDGFGDPATGEMACVAKSDQVENDGDCNDDDDTINPDADEVCDDDNVDEDCDGKADDADDSVDLGTGTLWHRDLDGDGFGNPDATLRACDAADGRVVDGTDCDDDDADANPRDGCPANYDGVWDTKIEMEITFISFGETITCTAEGALTIAQDLERQVDPGGTWLCETPDGEAADLDISARFSDEDSLAGEYDLSGESFPFTADFTDSTLEGSGSTTITVGGERFGIKHSLRATKR